MNPETHHFEELGTAQMLSDAIAKGWKVFTPGEKVTVNDTYFSVVDISPTKLTLRPYGLMQLARGSGRAWVDQFQLPVMIEHDTLGKNLEELHVFIEDSAEFRGLNKIDQRRMVDQRAAMTVYRNILRERIARFSALPL